jgi:hypothetical protein
LTARQLANRLHGFVAGGAPPESGQMTVTPSEGQRVEISNTFHIQVGATADRGWDASPADLPEQVAEILRQQAIQHGIDVT